MVVQQHDLRPACVPPVRRCAVWQVLDKLHEMLKDTELMGRESLVTLSSARAPTFLQVRGRERARSNAPRRRVQPCLMRGQLCARMRATCVCVRVWVHVHACGCACVHVCTVDIVNPQDAKLCV